MQKLIIAERRTLKLIQSQLEGTPGAQTSGKATEDPQFQLNTENRTVENLSFIAKNTLTIS